MLRRIVALALILLVPGIGASVARAETVQEIVYVPTVGGADIRVVLARDPALDPQPILLTYSPYYGTPFASVDAPSDQFSQRYVPRGIARAWADLLGTNGSSGCWDYGGVAEQQSGIDLVNALAKLPWSSGRVAMIGLSYDGTTANMVAVRGDDVPGLAAIIPMSAISRWYEYAYYQGARYNAFGTPPLFDFEIARHPGPGDPLTDEHAREALIARTGECDSVEHTVRAHEDSPAYDAFWLERDYLKGAANIKVPVLVVHGWQDYNVKQQQGINMWDAIPEDDPGTAEREGVPFKLLYTFQGGHSFPSTELWWPTLDAFLDRTLFGVQNGIEQGPRSITQPAGATDGASLVEWTFPPPGTRTIPLHLRAGGSLSVEPGTDGPVSYTDLSHRGARGNLDSVESSSRLLYRSPPLAADTRIAGSVEVDLSIAVDGTRGQLDPILFDIDEDGILQRVAPGMMSLRFRNGLSAPQDMVPGVPARAVAVIKPQDYIFGAGHRIAISVQSSSANDVVPDVPGTYTIYQGDSVVRIPVVGAPSDARALFS